MTTTNKTLRVRARGTAMVCDLGFMSAGGRRYIGRGHDPKLGHEIKDENGAVTGFSGGWPAIAEDREVPALADYKKDVREGSLWAADQETAEACGVEFDPDFGGEFVAPDGPAPMRDPAAPRQRSAPYDTPLADDASDTTDKD